MDKFIQAVSRRVTPPFQGFLKASVKTQFLLVVCFLVSYLSPLLGIILAIIAYSKNLDKRYKACSLLGGGAALLFYTIGYLQFLI